MDLAGGVGCVSKRHVPCTHPTQQPSTSPLGMQFGLFYFQCHRSRRGLWENRVFSREVPLIHFFCSFTNVYTHTHTINKGTPSPPASPWLFAVKLGARQSPLLPRMSPTVHPTTTSCLFCAACTARGAADISPSRFSLSRYFVQMKSVAALAALVASASAINPARYVRIYDAQNDASDFINLQLVTVFGTSPRHH
jgi:hypothetical protein